MPGHAGSPAALALLAVGIVNVLPLLCTVLLARQRERVAHAIPTLLALAVGALMGAAFFDLLPHAYASTGHPELVGYRALVGFLAVMLLDWLLRGGSNGAAQGRTPLVVLNLGIDGLHNVLDAIVVAAAFVVSRELGLAAALAVLLHELPREMGTFGALVHGGMTPWRAIGMNAASGALAVAAAAVTLWVGEVGRALAGALAPYAAGSFLYVSAAVLLPALVRLPVRSRWVAPAAMALGATLVALAQVRGG